MKKSVYLLAASMAMTGVAAVAAPVPSQSVAGLLGLKEVPAAEFDAAQVVNAPQRVASRTEADASPALYASVVYPNNLNGMWSFSTTTYSSDKLASPMPLATGGGLAAKNYYYCNTYQEAMGFEAVALFSYNLSDWSVDEQYTGKITDVATTMAYSQGRDVAYGCFINEQAPAIISWNGIMSTMPRSALCVRSIAPGAVVPSTRRVLSTLLSVTATCIR